MSSFKTKTIDFNGQRNILMQNENGPCCLLALVNTILLTVNELSINEIHELVVLVNSADEVTLEELTAKLRDIINAYGGVYAEASLSLLGRLNEGLNINPKFDGGFEESVELSIFKSLNISLLHGWICDPSGTEYQTLMKYNSYETSQNVLIEAYELENKAGGQLDEVDQMVINDSKVIKSFFARTATQLTDFGLNYLKSTLNANSIAVLFRNDHFSTIVKSGNDLFFLVTDAGYINDKRIVWESLLSINGANNSFFTGDFSPLLDESFDPFADAGDGDAEDRDRALAMAIQEEEDSKAANALSKQYQKKGKAQSKKSKPKKEKNKRDKKCIIM